MIRLLLVFSLALCAGSRGFAQAPNAAKVWDSQLTSLEKEFVPLVEAVPEAAINFAPTAGEFKNARTFAQQATHVATVLYEVSAAILQEKVPVDAGKAENGPPLTVKADIVKYVKEAFTYGHRAMNSLTNENQMGLVKSAFDAGQTTRLYMASVAIWHSYDHYGQMAVYARMNAVVPPASRQ
jgi:hypothetical protein